MIIQLVQNGLLIINIEENALFQILLYFHVNEDGKSFVSFNNFLIIGLGLEFLLIIAFLLIITFCLIITNFLDFYMNSNNAITYEKSLQMFKKHQASLPQKIRWKLYHISCMINERPTEKTQNLPEQYQLEIQDLKDVNQKGLKIIFTSIVQTLFSEQIPIDKQCLIRRKGFFKSWSDGFIKYDDSYIYFNSSNKTSRYKFKNVDISLNSSSKRAFDFFYKTQQLMTVKFQRQQSMITMYKMIKNLIYNEKNKYDQYLISNIKSITQTKPKKQNNQQKGTHAYQQLGKNVIIQPKSNDLRKDPVLSKKFSQNQPHQKRVMQFQKSIISQAQNQIIIRNSHNQPRKQLKLNAIPQGYLPRQSNKKMFLSLHSKQVKLTLQIIIKLCDEQTKLNEVFSCLCLYKNWNSKVMREEVCYQMMFQQKAIIYRVYEKSGALLSKPRQTYTILEFRKVTPNTAILVQETLENQDRGRQYVRAYLRTVFFIQIHQNSLKVSIQSEFDPKGYCSTSESQDLLFSIYKDIIHFQNYLSEYTIKVDKHRQDLLFQDMVRQPISQKQQISEQLPMQSSKSMDQLQNQKSSDSEQQQVKKNFQIYKKSSNLRQPFLQIHPDNPNRIPTLQYIQLIRKRQFQRYYLKHHYQFHVLKDKYDSYLPWYCLEELLRRGGQYQVTQKYELKFINEKLIQSQKDILRFLIRQIGANLVSGKSVQNVSLPVDIFEPRTLLERGAASLGRCPDYLLRVCQSQVLEQMMSVTAFIATLPALQLVMQKPFNPILGQTFQCYLKGIPLCYEQTSHHPPISSYYMQCQQFKLYGNLITFADVGVNSGFGGNVGAMHIIFKNGSNFQCYFPLSEISGLIYGDRKFRCYGRGYIVQKSKKIFSQFSIQKSKKSLYQTKDKLLPGSIIGGIFNVNNKFLQFLNSYGNNLKKFPGISKEHVSEKLVHISGIWFDKIYMNEREITKDIRAYPVQYYPCSLASDANFRLDVLFHKQNNLSESQKQKQILEDMQRDDKKLRQKNWKLVKK